MRRLWMLTALLTVGTMLGALAAGDAALKGRWTLTFSDDAGWHQNLLEITTADSKLRAIKILAHSLITVKDVVILIDREQGGKESLEKAGLALHSATTISRLLAFYQDRGIITPEIRGHTLEKLHRLNGFMSRIYEQGTSTPHPLST